MNSHSVTDSSSWPPVDVSWTRIDTWLARHAPASAALLRPPARQADIEAAERRLGLAFTPDLVASLRCHDGTEEHAGAPVLGSYGPFASLDHLVRDAELLRSVDADLPPAPGMRGLDEELAAFWRREWLLITRGIGWEAQDGLFLTLRDGEYHGRIGRYFNEDAPSFTSWMSLRHLLAAFADSLERRLPIGRKMPVTHEGRLLWDDETRVIPHPRSPLALAGADGEPSEPEPPAAPAQPRHRPGPVLRVTVGRPGTVPPPVPRTLVFAARLGPAALLERMGAVPDTVRERSRGQAAHAAAGSWAAARPMVRVGSCGDWTFALEEPPDHETGQCRRPEVLRRVSAGTRAVALWRQGGEVRLTVWEDGAPAAGGETARSPRTDYQRLADGRLIQRAGIDPWPAAGTAHAELLGSLRDRFGIVFDQEEAFDAPLLSGLLLPVLSDLPERASRPVRDVRGFDLGALIADTDRPRLRAALLAQLRRLAAETGLDTHPEVPPALALLDSGQAVPVTDDDPLGIRLRTLDAEARAAGGRLRDRRAAVPEGITAEDRTAWSHRSIAGAALRRFALLPVEAAAAPVLSARLTAAWRTELAEDLRSVHSTTAASWPRS
ncbi:SMI1/KNR4 family protein [Streptomyces johnsoniae]|uniref:Knr4/Smi1-like domain-containing protein n=1 Tax=Streptomyces johnsoniae TaxID=3075532 RepID=A0ABU2S1U7_9ACTN|nr:hypothetical protein [Streptomyces sp. DSM 41886]MDT0442414.1 hypothetical protein [Streptomyces sp. DSM 41886]